MDAANKTFLEAEDAVMNNVVHKLRIYMDRNKLTLHGLASKIGFAYQPFWRLMSKKHSPTLTSLAMIVPHFDCTISELIHDDIFIDIDLFSGIDSFIKKNCSSKIRMYAPYSEIAPVALKEFVAIKTDIHPKDKHSNNIENTHNMGIFYSVDSIDIDGVFLATYKNKNSLLQVESVSSQYIWTSLSGENIKIDKSEVIPLAKFFNYLNLDPNKSAVVGVTK